MTLLLNVDSGRELREGDHVRLPSGALGQVVGIDVLSETPLVVQRKKGLLSQHSANDVVLYREGNTQLEPLPPVAQIIQEGRFRENYRTCSSMLCISLIETPFTITLIPKQSIKLKDMLEEKIISSKSFGEAILELLKSAFVSRLPHLVEFELQTAKAVTRR